MTGPSTTPIKPTAYRAPRLVTCDPARTTPENPLGVIERAGFVVDEGGRFSFVGSEADLPKGLREVTLDLGVTLPGLVDAHTHAAWVGSRHVEYALRMAGADYREIAAAGGGIVASQRAIQEATEDAIAQVLAARLRRMAALGVTTCEVKSGYGLLPHLEIRQLEAIARAGLKQPGKSACFMCPSSRKPEVTWLRDTHPALYGRSLEMERRAIAGEGQAPAARVKGLGRHWNWATFAGSDVASPEVDCGCYDGE